MRYCCTSLLGPVDAGKTTLSEALLYESGAVRRLGSVDKKNTLLDNHELERSRGITIFSKQAVATIGDVEFTFLDTPGHVDFSAETERTLQVLDYAILLVDAMAGVRDHTLTLWRLLTRYEVPTFIFVNKMDRRDAEKDRVLEQIKSKLDDNCIDFSEERDEEVWAESVSMCREDLLEAFLEGEYPDDEAVAELIKDRKLFPVFFGSALKLDGISYFANAIAGLVRDCKSPFGGDFAARVYKIGRDENGSRLAFIKVTGGSLKAKEKIDEEKVDQIRIYSGTKYETVPEVNAGRICAVTGLAEVHAGDGLGAEQGENAPVLMPVMQSTLMLPPGTDASKMMEKLELLAEEEPGLAPEWIEETQSILMRFMGQVQTEVVTALIKERFDVDVSFGPGQILYKETIAAPSEGAGHFEPLRHYAEVRLIIEPAEPGSGLHFESRLSTDVLAGHWQRLILGQLKARVPRGVLTRSEFTDAHVVLVGGKAHPKHTEGGDFRQAARRAFRQALMKAENILLEPWYEFRLELPMENVGRAMNDLQMRGAKFQAPDMQGEAAVIVGRGPVAGLQDYQQEVITYTSGKGRLTCSADGYEPCANAEEVVLARGYDPEADLRNTADSVFCTHGAGYTIPWWDSDNYMHTPPVLKGTPAGMSGTIVDENGYSDETSSGIVDGEVNAGARLGDSSVAGGAYANSSRRASTKHDYDAGRALDAELDVIFKRTFGSDRGIRESEHHINKVAGSGSYAPAKPASDKSAKAIREGKAKVGTKPEYLLVDGYNVIFAWPELDDLARTNIDAARDALADKLSNYSGYRGCSVILVFDAYKVKGHACEITRWHNIEIVYTAEAETADQYIEKTTHEMAKNYHVRVATSDRLEQIIILGEGAVRVSARELQKEIAETERAIKENVETRKFAERRQDNGKRYLFDDFDTSGIGV